MNTFMKFVAITSIFAVYTFADESFGGIGVVYKITKSGAKVQDVIPQQAEFIPEKRPAGRQAAGIPGVFISGWD